MVSSCTVEVNSPHLGCSGAGAQQELPPIKSESKGSDNATQKQRFKVPKSNTCGLFVNTNN